MEPQAYVTAHFTIAKAERTTFRYRRMFRFIRFGQRTSLMEFVCNGSQLFKTETYTCKKEILVHSKYALCGCLKFCAE